MELDYKKIEKELKERNIEKEKIKKDFVTNLIALAYSKDKIKNLKKSRENLSAEIAKYINIIEGYKDERLALKSEVENLYERLENISKEKGDKEESLKNIEEELEKKLNEMETLQKNINDLNKNLEEVKTEKINIEEKYEESKKEREKIEEEAREERYRANKEERRAELKGIKNMKLLKEIAESYSMKIESNIKRADLIEDILREEESQNKFRSQLRQPRIIRR